MWRRFHAFARTIRRRRTFEDSMSDELRLHIDLYTADLVARGIPLNEAARRARMEFGSVDNVRNDCREAHGLGFIDALLQDLRYAVRLMRKTPGATAVALATLALCLGANLTIFAIVDSVLLRPLPFPDADRLVRIFNSYPKAGVPDDGANLTNYAERRGQLASFAGVSLYREGTAVVGEPGATERELVTRVTADFFSMLGTGPVLGRAFSDGEMSPGADNVAVVTDAYWRLRLGANPDVVGQTLAIDGVDTEIIGVLGADFRFLSSKARIYLPLASNAEARSPDRRHSGNSSQMIGRLAPGVTIVDAQSEIDTHNAAVEAGSALVTMLASTGFRSLIVPLHQEHVAAIRPTLLLVQAGAVFLLLIGAVNLVTLLLIRTSGRLKELAVRQAIGASRQRVIGEVIVETTVLVLIGGLLGLGVAAFGVQLVAQLGADQLPLGAVIALDWRVLAPALAMVLTMGILMGLPVAWYGLHGMTTESLRGESRSSTATRSTQRLRHGFLMAQVALSVVLLSGAGLLGVSLKKAMEVSPGFRHDHVLTGRLALPVKDYGSAPARFALIDRLMTALASQPDIVAAGVATNVPLSGRDIKSAITVKGQAPRAGESPQGHYAFAVGGNYFAALGVSLLEGRFLSENDTRRRASVAVVDEHFAQRYWPAGSAVGQQLFHGPSETDGPGAFTVVGVVGALKQTAVTEQHTQGAVFFPYHERFSNELFVVARTSLPPEAVAVTLRRTVRAVDPQLPIDDLRSMDQRIAASLTSRSTPALLAALFSSIALLLAALGTYGVLSYAVAQRRRDIALRLALGARPQQIRRQFVMLATRLLAIGATAGLAGAWATGQGMSALLFQVPAFHPPTTIGAAAVMLLVCLVAAAAASHRATRISALEAAE